MNKERMLLLADVIGSLSPEKFNMENWITDKSDETAYTDKENIDPLDCNTVCCIAGWAVAIKNNFEVIDMNKYKNKQAEDYFSIKEEARQYLDLTKEQASNIFFPNLETLWDEIEDDEIDYIYERNIYVGITNKIASKFIKDIANGKYPSFYQLDPLSEDEDFAWENY